MVRLVLILTIVGSIFFTRITKAQEEFIDHDLTCYSPVIGSKNLTHEVIEHKGNMTTLTPLPKELVWDILSTENEYTMYELLSSSIGEDIQLYAGENVIILEVMSETILLFYKGVTGIVLVSEAWFPEAAECESFYLADAKETWLPTNADEAILVFSSEYDGQWVFSETLNYVSVSEGFIYSEEPTCRFIFMDNEYLFEAQGIANFLVCNALDADEQALREIIESAMNGETYWNKAIVLIQ